MSPAERRPRREPGAPAGSGLRSVLALALLGAVGAVCFSLGMWQLDRAAERDALHDAIERGRRQAPVALAASTPTAALAPWRAATAQGRWSAPHTVLLENRNLDGRPGYWVATPLLLESPPGSAGTVFPGDGGVPGATETSTADAAGEPASAATHAAPGEPANAVLVLRGWLPRDMQAGGALPAIPEETGPVQVRGELHAHVPRIFELWEWAGGRSSQLPGALPPKDGAVPVVQNLELAGYARASGLRLLPVVLAQTQDSIPAVAGTAAGEGGTPGMPGAGGHAAGPRGGGAAAAAGPDAPPPVAARQALRREWPGPSLDSDQNRGYALQWFGFSAIAAIAALFLARGLLRRSLSRGRR